jgi:hypothetical protein
VCVVRRSRRQRLAHPKDHHPPPRPTICTEAGRPRPGVRR